MLRGKGWRWNASPDFCTLLNPKAVSAAHSLVPISPKQYSVGEGLHRLSMGVSGVSAATTWQSGTSRGLHQGSQGPLVHLWFLAVITHFLYIAAAKLEICPQFLFILMKHRGVEIIVIIWQLGQVKTDRLIERKKASDHGIWNVLILMISFCFIFPYKCSES